MPLNFDENAYGRAFQQGEENRLANRDRFPEMVIQPIAQGLESLVRMQQNKQASDQKKKLYELQLKEAQLKQKQYDDEYLPLEQLGQLLSNNGLSQDVAPQSLLDKVSPPQGMGEAAMPMGQQPGGMRASPENFRMWQQGRLRPPQVDMSQQALAQPDMSVFNLPQEVLKFSPKQLESLERAKKLFGSMNKQQDAIPSNVFPMAVSGDYQGLADQYPNGVPLKIANLAANAGIKNKNFEFKQSQEQEKKQQEMQKAQDAWNSRKGEAEMILQKIDEALPTIDNFSAGFGSYTKSIPGTPAMNLKSKIDSIVSNLGLSKLMEMKNNSKAGASGMGQLSDREMTLLTSAIASLNQAQDAKALKEQFLKVRTHYSNLLQMMNGVNPYQNGQTTQPGTTGKQVGRFIIEEE